MHSDYDNKICNDIMHNDITSINLICMYAVMAHYCGQHIRMHSGGGSAVSAQQRPCSETSDCSAAVCCMGPAWGARWLRPAAECSTAAAAVQRNYGFLILI